MSIFYTARICRRRLLKGIMSSFNTEDFNAKAKAFSAKYDVERRDLEKCLESKANDDINFICAKEKERYLNGIAHSFCKSEYDFAVRCQKDHPDQWASACFTQNTNFGKCADGTLRRLYIFNLENNKKNPAALGGGGSGRASSGEYSSAVPTKAAGGGGEEEPKKKRFWLF